MDGNDPHGCSQNEVLTQLKLCIEQHTDRFHQGDLQFQQVSQTMAALLKGQSDMVSEQAKTNKRLFVDNGTISMQTKIDRHNNLLRGIMWAVTSISLVVAGIIVKLIVNSILHGNGISN